MSAFTDAALDYLRGQRRLARVATVGIDDTPHVVPSGFTYNPDLDTIGLGGHSVERTRKFRDVARTGRAAVVIDDLASTDPWHPRAVEVRGHAEAVTAPDALTRLHPDTVRSGKMIDTVHPIASDMQARLITEERHRTAGLRRRASCARPSSWQVRVGSRLIRAGQLLQRRATRPTRVTTP